MKNILARAAAASALAFVAGSAFALPVVTYSQGLQNDGTAVAANRSVEGSESDNDVNTFYSLGIGGSIELDFTPQTLVSPSTVVELTFNKSLTQYPEASILSFSTDGTTFTDAVELFNDGTFGSVATGFSIAASAPTATAPVSFTISFTDGTYTALKLTDSTDVAFYTGKSYTSDGFDVAEITASAVPLPAAGVLLLGLVGGVGFMKRRHKQA